MTEVSTCHSSYHQAQAIADLEKYATLSNHSEQNLDNLRQKTEQRQLGVPIVKLSCEPDTLSGECQSDSVRMQLAQHTVSAAQANSFQLYAACSLCQGPAIPSHGQ